MNEIILNFQQATPLKRLATPEDYKLYRAALEWNLDDPIIIESEADMQSEPSWRGKIQPYQHQIDNIRNFCKRLPVALFADDVGLGKTVSAGLIASELMARRKIKRILIVCPKLITEQWKDELKEKFGIESVVAVGKELLTARLPKNEGAIITTYQSADKYLNVLQKEKERNKKIEFEMLILDEAHKLRRLHPDEKKAPKVAQSFHKVLSDRLFKYVLMLTATPIQNRLWDIYSLIDLLTAAKGHSNPFGTKDKFNKIYIDDARSTARKLKKRKEENFRSIVKDYMHRTRRIDAKLLFPTREILMHKFEATLEEMEIFNLIKVSWNNPLVKSSMLQALVSSPEALIAQLKTTSNKGDTLATDLLQKVNMVFKKIGIPAKLKALGTLIDTIILKQDFNWRIVIFTERRDTQKSINDYIAKTNPQISIGIINGESGQRNQETIQRFNKNPPETQIIVSTRAGSEGVNLQAANILVNYDLPWNPMIVEQRIGRIHRLGSKHASVCIYNLVLKDTYDEDIVGVLNAKLQMVTETIGDIDAILSNAGFDDDRVSGTFEEKINKLVIASAEGKNIEKETQLISESIENGRKIYEEEKQFIEDTLDSNFKVPKDNIIFPKIPVKKKSMTEKEFAFAALKNLGATLIEEIQGDYYYKLHDRTLKIRFDEVENSNALLCKSGNSFFDANLILPIIKDSKYYVNDLDHLPLPNLEILVKNWISEFSGDYKSYQIIKTRACFKGKLLLRVKITVVCDSFETLLDIDCLSQGIFLNDNQFDAKKRNTFDDIGVLGLSLESYKDKVMEDVGISEFNRFYLERLEKELKGAGKNSVKQKSIEYNFTPSVSINLVGLEGDIHSELKAVILYQIESINYESKIILKPSSSSVIEKPEIRNCDLTGINAPSECFAKCEITGKEILKHHLIKSEISDRYAQSGYIVVCSLTGKKVISDEIEKSDISGKPVASKFLKVSELSKTKGEPEYFGNCDFTFIELLNKELLVSQVSGKLYRIDQELVSAFSGKVGHKSEFIFCGETGKPILASEAEQSEDTGKYAYPGLLQVCGKTNKRVLPSELDLCAVTEKKALKRFFVSSSISNIRFLKEIAVESNSGKLFCTQSESAMCYWTGQRIHPADLATCRLTSVKMNANYISENNGISGVLYKLLAKKTGLTQGKEHWNKILELANERIDSTCKIDLSEVSPTGKSMAVSLEFSTWFGLKTRYAGLIYSIENKRILGHIISGKRENNEWTKENIY